MEPTILEAFISHYQDHYSFYQQAASRCAELCESMLERNGIRAIVTSRAKRPDRLLEKIAKRQAAYQRENSGVDRYRTFDDIKADIVDLAGVRISLYFPGDRAEVHKILHGCFSVRQLKTFPSPQNAPATAAYQKRFSGYFATHYRISLGPDAGEFENVNVEIQVASVLMHAWSEVEHDLSYKTYTGLLSTEEEAILDELNGLVLAGEISLERLQQAIRRRVDVAPRPFANHYELGVFLLDYVRQQTSAQTADISVGNVALFFRFLQQLGLDHPQDLAPYLEQLEPDKETTTLTDQLCDALLTAHPEHFPLYRSLRDALPHMTSQASRQKIDDSIQKVLGFFLFRWMLFETTARNLLTERGISRTSTSNSIRQLRDWELLSDEMAEQLDRLRRLRHTLLYGGAPPSAEEIIDAAHFLEDVIKELLHHLPADLWQSVLQQLAPLNPEKPL